MTNVSYKGQYDGCWPSLTTNKLANNIDSFTRIFKKPHLRVKFTNSGWMAAGIHPNEKRQFKVWYGPTKTSILEVSELAQDLFGKRAEYALQ